MEYFYELFENNCKEIHVGDKTIKVVDLIQATKLSIDLGIIPDVISKFNFVKLFKFCQPSEINLSSKAQYRDYLTQDEYKYLLASVGIFSYNEDETLKSKFPRSEQKVISIMKLYTK